MHLIHSLPRLLLAALALPAALFAQATGSVTGRVSDAATGRSLQGAVVRVLGTSATAYTDADGRFVLSALPAGPLAQVVAVNRLDLRPLAEGLLALRERNG